MHISKRILFPFDGSSIGGSHLSSVTLSHWINTNTDHNVFFLLRSSKGPFAEYLSSLGIKYTSLECSAWLYPLRAFLFLLNNNYTLVHAHDRRMHLIWLFLCKLSATSFVWHQRTPCYSRTVRMLSRFSSVRLSISGYVADTLKPSSSTIIYNPVVLDQSINGENSAFSLKLNCYSQIICWVANWLPRKNLPLFIRAAIVYLQKFNSSALFCVLGRPNDAISSEINYLIAQSGFSANFLILGSIHPSWPYIKASDLFVSTSVNEGMGRTLVESMLVNTPVLASDSGAHPEILKYGRYGFLFPLSDSLSQPSLLADQMHYVLSQPVHMLNKLTSEAYNYSLHSFSPYSHAQAILKSYNTLG